MAGHTEEMKAHSGSTRSLKGKFWFLGFLIGGSALLTLVVFGVTISKMNSAQRDYQGAVELSRIVNELKSEYFIMEASEYGFIADSTNEGLWDRRLKAEKTLVELREKIRTKLSDAETMAFIDKAVDINEKILTPVSLEAKATIDKDRMAVLKLYALKVTPGYGLARLTITKAVKRIQEKETAAETRLNQVVNIGGMLLTGVLLFSVIFSVVMIVKMGRSIVDPLDLAVRELTKETEEARGAASKINVASQTLAQSTTEQAAALEETAASVEQLNAMTMKNAENATRSGEVANQSNESANNGKRAVDEMIAAIKDISQSNTEIMAQIEESNKQITEITKVISEIGTKTQVINDIVFQTKLLSFNASVEAARAGEHGKGFAVVAEEVGKLAQMSGSAAEEIAKMLEGGIRKVESIVTNTRTNVERLMAQAREKLDRGTQVAEGSGKVLDEIVTRVSEVNRMIGEISVATSEQANGLQEIAKAMSQVGKGMHQNSDVSHQVGELATQLNRQSESLGTVVSSLVDLIKGQSEGETLASHASH
ncbi:methyl-accepting chemotaxis protein [Bdellovibrionota bacterium FG-1]